MRQDVYLIAVRPAVYEQRIGLALSRQTDDIDDIIACTAIDDRSATKGGHVLHQQVIRTRIKLKRRRGRPDRPIHQIDGVNSGTRID